MSRRSKGPRGRGSRASVSSVGRRVGEGHLRVDVSRAVAKLREYQLADPDTWLQEVVRGAIALGATELRVSFGATDIELWWLGGELVDDELQTLLQELVSSDAPRRDGGIRRVATGLNTALAGRPRGVEVERWEAAAEGARVTYRPDHLDAGGAESLNQLEVERLAEAIPDEAHAFGEDDAWPKMCLRLKERLSLGALRPFRRVVRGEEPAAIRALREAADDVRIPLRIGDDVLHRETSGRDLLRVPLGPPPTTSFVALVDPGTLGDAAQDAIPAWVDYAERGVILARERLPLSEGYEPRRLRVPIRAFLDRDSLPTNAARSAIREGAGLDLALAPAEEALESLLDAAAHVFLGTPGGARDSLLPGFDEPPPARLRHALLHLVAAYQNFMGWAPPEGLPKGLRGLFSLPLVQDLEGKRRPIEAFALYGGLAWRSERAPNIEAVGDEVPAIPHLPPGDDSRVLAAAGLGPERDVLKVLQRKAEQVRHRTRFMGQATVPLRVTDRPGRRVWARAELDEGPMGARGQVTLDRGVGANGGGLQISILHASRMLDTHRVPLPFAARAVVESMWVYPAPDYRRAERDAAFSRVVDAATRGAFRAAEAAAAAWLGLTPPDGTKVEKGAPTADPSAARTLLNAAIAGELDATSPLRDAAIIPTRSRRRGIIWRSLKEIEATATRDGFLEWTPNAGADDRSPRDIAILDPSDALSLSSKLGVPSARVPMRAPSPPAAPTGHQISWSVDKDDLRLRVSLLGSRRESAWIDVAGGRQVEQTEVDTMLPLVFGADDPEAIVDDSTGRLVRAPSRRDAAQRWELEFYRALLNRVQGAPQPRLDVRGAPFTVERALTELRARAPGPLKKRARDLHGGLLDAPLIPTVTGQRRSLRALSEASPPLYVLPPGARLDFEHPDFDPLLLDDEWLGWVGQLTGHLFEDGAAHVDLFRRRAGGAARRAALLARTALPEPRVNPDALETLSFERRRFSGHLSQVAEGALTLTFSGRVFATLGAADLDFDSLPLLGRVEVPEDHIDPSWDTLTDEGVRSLRRVIRYATQQLLERVATRAPQRLMDPRMGSPRGALGGHRHTFEGGQRATADARAHRSVSDRAGRAHVASRRTAAREGRIRRLRVGVARATRARPRRARRRRVAAHPPGDHRGATGAHSRVGRALRPGPRRRQDRGGPAATGQATGRSGARRPPDARRRGGSTRGRARVERSPALDLGSR